MDWGTWAFAHTHLWTLFCACTCTQMQVCRHVILHCHALCPLGVPGTGTCCRGWRPAVSCSRAQHLAALLPCLPCVPAGCRSEGLRSPSESVFLRMEGIPFIQEELADNEENSKRQSECGQGTHTHTTLGVARAGVPWDTTATLGFCRQ